MPAAAALWALLLRPQLWPKFPAADRGTVRTVSSWTNRYKILPISKIKGKNIFQDFLKKQYSPCKENQV
jgi:hypothetical protein